MFKGVKIKKNNNINKTLFLLSVMPVHHIILYIIIVKINLY